MTRETKIGLLMGLGFIVVFAVLLLETGPKRPPTDELAMMISQQGSSATGRPDPVARLPEPVGGRQPTSLPSLSAVDSVPDALTQAPEPWNRALPNPPMLNARPDHNDLGPGGSAMTENLTPEPRIGPDPTGIDPVRVGPADETRPTRRPDAPDVSPSPLLPAPDPSPVPSQSAPGSPTDGSDGSGGLPTPYVVQKDDNLTKIARRYYNDASPPVLDFLVRSNSPKVKDRHSVIEGQTLLIPVLPANLTQLGRVGTADANANREPVRLTQPENPAPPRNGAGLRPLNAERIVPPSSVLVKVVLDRPGSATAPPVARQPVAADPPAKGEPAGSTGADVNKSRAVEPSKPTGAPRDEGGKLTRQSGGIARDGRQAAANDSKSGGTEKGATAGSRSPADAYRWYTIQPKDTLISIAEKHLGGKQNWEEIAKLNKSLKPTKLRAGDRIRLPKRKSASEGASSAIRSST